MKFRNNFEILKGREYVTPEVTTVEVMNEGVLCHSGESEDYNYWEFEW